MKSILENLKSIWNMEEIKMRQRLRDRNIKEGGRNTTHFQVVANQRNRKKMIRCFEGPNGLIEDNDMMLDHAVDFYKSMFGYEKGSGGETR